MSTFNGQKFVVEAISTVLNQTYKNFSLIILDDCSTDCTLEIVHNRFSVDPRVSIYKNKERMGMIYTWNKLIKLAKPETEYFAWLSDHDRVNPDWLEQLLTIYNTTENVSLVYAHTNAIDSKGKIIFNYSKFEYAADSNKILDRIYTLLTKDILYGNMIYGLFNFKILKKIGGYHKVLLPDTLTVWLVLLQGRICFNSSASWSRRYYDKYSLQRQKQSLGIPLNTIQVLLYPVTNAVYLYKKSMDQVFITRILATFCYLISVGKKQFVRSCSAYLKQILSQN